jgi:hypothetical protein
MESRPWYIAFLEFLVIIGLCAYIFLRPAPDSTKNEIRLMELKKKDSANSKAIDSLRIIVSQQDSEIDYKNRNPKIVIDYYEKKISDVKHLGTDESIEYITKRLSEEDSVR